MNWRRIGFWSLLGAGLLAALVYAFRPQAIPVDLQAATRGALLVTVDEEGETRVRDVFVLSAPVTGRLRRIESEVGDEVIAGKTIVTEIEPIDPAFLDARSQSQAEAAVKAAEAAIILATAELEQARVEFNFARIEFDRAQRLVRNETISQRELDDAERAFKSRQAAVTTAEAGLRMRESELVQAQAQLVSPTDTQALHGACECVSIPAPVSGSVLRVLHESEGVVEAGDALLEIGDPKDLEIVADLLSSDAVKVKAGQRVIIEDWGGQRPLAGRVRRVEPFGFTKISALGIEEQRVNVIIDFADAPEHWRSLGHGYQVEVRIVLWENDDVLKLPLTALFRDGERWMVFVENAGRARRREVSIGRRNGLEAAITSGLEAGERVVLHPSDRVDEDVRIAPRT